MTEATQTVENLIDLSKFNKDEVALIAREFIRIVYLETLDQYVTEQQKADVDKTVSSNMEDALKGLETTIILLDQGTEFLDYVHQDAEVTSDNDDEFDRF